MNPKRHPVLTVLLTLLTTAFILPILPASAAVSYLSTLAGPSVAAMYDSGLEYDDALSRIVVADTGNDRILFYDLNGTNLGGGFGMHGVLDGQFDSPRDVAIGPNSMIFVADAGNNRVQAFTSTGQFLWQHGGTGACDLCLNTPIGVTYDATNNVVLIASTGQDHIKAFNIDGTFAWKDLGTVSGGENVTFGFNAPRDVARGPDGRIWLSDYDHHLVKAYDVTSAGVWTSNTPAITLGTGDGTPGGHNPGEFNFPYNVDFSPDGHTAYVSSTGDNRVSVWDVTTPTSPVFVKDIGHNCDESPDTCADPPADFGTIDTLRRVAVTPDGTVITADFWGNGIQVWQADGTPVREIELVTPPAPGFAQAFGVAIAPNGGVYVVDRLNQRIEQFDDTGAFVRTQGNRGTTAGRYSWPEAVAVAPDGSVWIGDTRNDKLHKLSANLSSPVTYGSSGVFAGTASPGRFNYIEDLDVGPNGLVYVADTNNNRIQIFNPTTQVFTAFGTIGSANGQFNHPQGVAVSATNIYVADTDNNRIQKLDLNGTWVATYGGVEGSGAGQLDHPQGVAIGADGSLWVADTDNNRIVHLTSTTMTDLGEGFGGAGTGNMQFDLPHSLAAISNKLYVADTFNNRVQIFDTGPIPDSTLPTVAITTPTAGQSFPQGTVLFNGTAADNVGVTAVRIGIQNTSTGQWYQSDGTWGTTQQLQTTALSSPGGTSTGWSYSFTFPTGVASYSLLAESADAAGNLANPKPTRAFSVTSALDTTAPTVTVVVPTPNASLPNAPLTFTGSATDNLGVTRFDFDIKDRNTNLWWRSDGTWGAFQLQPGSLGTPGSTSTSWSATWTPPPGAGAYSVFAQPQDARGNKVNKTVQFNVTAGGGTPDTAAPTVTVTTPTTNQAFPAGTIAFGGNATDNVGVARFDFDIKDLNTNLWWRNDGTWGAFQLQPGSLGTPGGTSTTWSASWTPPAGAGVYSFFAQPQDAAGNKVNKTVQFSVTAGGGGLTAAYNRQVSNAGGIAPLYPAGGATAANGDRYVADSGGSRIVKITSAGAQTTISDALTGGWNDPRDLEFDVSDPTVLWVVNTSDSEVVKMSTSGTILATFGSTSVYKTPYGLANDATGVYVADTYNQRVVKINKTTGATIWTATTCNGTAFLRPRDVGVGSDGNVYVTDTDNNRIVRLNAGTGACQGSPSTFGTNGVGNLQFKAPRSITGDGATGLWIADAGNNRIKHVTFTGALIGSPIGSAGTGNAQFRSAHCVFRDGAFIDVCDTFNYRFQRFSVNGSGSPVFDSIVGGTQPANGGFNGAFDVAYAADGSMFAVDWFNHRIEKFDAAGNFLLAFGGYGSPNGALIFPRGVTIAPNGDVVVMDSENNRIDIFTQAGAFVKSIKPTTGVSTTAFSRPYQVAVGPNGTYWVADTLNNRIVNIDTNGQVLASWNGGARVNAPRGVAVDASGNVYVSNTNNRVDKYTSAGTWIAQLATNGTGPLQVKGSYGLRIVGTGANAMLLIADAGNNRIVAMTLTGTAITTFGATGSGNGQFSSPRGMDRNPLTGEIAVADFLNNRLSIWTS